MKQLLAPECPFCHFELSLSALDIATFVLDSKGFIAVLELIWILLLTHQLASGRNIVIVKGEHSLVMIRVIGKITVAKRESMHFGKSLGSKETTFLRYLLQNSLWPKKTLNVQAVTGRTKLSW